MEKSACDAYGVGKSTLHDRKKAYEASGKNKYSLVPKSTRPHHTRTMTLNPQLVEFIKAMRVEYGNLGRAKIKPFLDEYAKSIDVNSYATTKISTIVRRKNFFFERKKKKKTRKPLTSWVKRSPKEKSPGYIERFNRTFKEEFVYRYELSITEDRFKQKLTNYLVWYNTKRPHCSLNMKSPLQYMQTYR